MAESLYFVEKNCWWKNSFIYKTIARSTHPFNYILSNIPQNWKTICNNNKFGLFEIIACMSFFLKHIDYFNLLGDFNEKFNIQASINAKSTSLRVLTSGPNPNPQSAFSTYLTISNFSHIFFTDGSRQSGLPSARVGFAIISQNLACLTSKRINNYSSIFDAEAQSILSALEIIDKEDHLHPFIASDS